MNQNKTKLNFSQKQIIIAICVSVFLLLCGILIFSQSTGSANNSVNSNSNSVSSSNKSSTNSTKSSVASSQNLTSSQSVVSSQNSLVTINSASSTQRAADPIPVNPTPEKLLEKTTTSSVDKPAEIKTEIKDILPQGDWKPVSPQKPSMNPEG